MRELILFAATWFALIALSSQVAINHNIQEEMFEGPTVYVDAEEEIPSFDRLPLEEEGEAPRAKRSIKYKILESQGLHSHFRTQIQDEDVLKNNPHRSRYRRNVKSELHSDEVEDVDNVEASSKRSEGGDFSVENIPQAQKQTQQMNPAYYRSDDSRLMDKWVKAPYADTQARSYKEDDSQAESSGSVVTKNRSPRVNFITQQGQGNSGGANSKDDTPVDGPEARERERERERERDRDRDNQNNNNNNNNNNNKPNNDDGYRKPANSDRYYPSSYNKVNNYDAYDRQYYPSAPAPQTYNNNRDYYGYNPYYEKYDPYYERYFDRNIQPPPGMGRMTPPHGPSSSFYYRHQYNEYDDYLPRSVPNYYYSDKRFDLPMEPRENYESYRPYLYNNEVNNNRPGRIVYYANLPEVVRTQNNYRSATARYGDQPMYNYYYNSNNNNYDRDDYQTRTAKAIAYRDIPASTTMRVSSTQVRADTPRDRSYYG